MKDALNDNPSIDNTVASGGATAHLPLSELADDDLVDEATMCRLIGGERSPIHRSTLWRGIANGRYPAPLKIGPSINRWRVRDGRQIVARAEAARAGGEAA